MPRRGGKVLRLGKRQLLTISIGALGALRGQMQGRWKSVMPGSTIFRRPSIFDMRLLALLPLLALSGCASMSPEEINGLTYDSPLSSRQVYERFTERCGIEPKDTGWTNGAGNGFGMDATYDPARAVGLITYYHISFGIRSEPGSFWDRTFGQVVTISKTSTGSRIELRGQTAAHLMRSKYKEIGALLKKESACPA